MTLQRKHDTGLLHLIYVNMQDIQHYSINSLLCLGIVKEKCVLMYRELITQLYIYENAIRKKKRILNTVRNTVRKTNPDYYLVIKRLHLYYNMKLVTFCIESNKI